MIILEKRGNMIRKLSEDGSWFLRDFREITNYDLVDGVQKISDLDLHVELEGNLFLLNVNNLIIDSLSFNDSEELKNYLLNG